jgi:hypothetical protein
LPEAFLSMKFYDNAGTDVQEGIEITGLYRN